MTDTEAWNWNSIKPYANNERFVGRTIVADGVTIKRLEVRAGALAPSHQHPYDQWVHVYSGTMRITYEGAVFVLGAGSVLKIPANKPHSAYYETNCEIMEFGLGREAEEKPAS